MLTHLFRGFFNFLRKYFTNLRHYGIAAAIFIVGLLLSLSTFNFYRKQESANIHAQFERLADLRLFFIHDLLVRTLEQLNYAKQFYLASTDVTSDDFTVFSEYLFELYPNLNAIGWLEEKPPQNLFSQIHFANLSSKNSSIEKFFPVTYLETGRLRSWLVDSEKYEEFVRLFEKSKHSSEITLSETIDTLRDHEQLPGFFLFNPIFGSDTSSTALKGVLIGFSSFGEILKNARIEMDPMGINIGIYDISDGNDHLLYWSPSILKSTTFNRKIAKETWSRAHDFKIGNRNWKIVASSTPAFFQLYHRWGHWEVLILGILISGLTAFYFLVLVNRRLLVEQEVHERVEELATTNQLLKQEVLERKKMEEEFMRNERYLQRRHEAVEYLTKFTVSELKHGINEVLLRTASVMQIDRVGVWFYETENDEQKLACAGLYILSTNAFMSHLEFTSSYFPHYFEALLSHSQLIIPSTTNEKLNKELSSYLAAFHIISKLDIPIVFEDKLSGVLVLEETRAHREWTLEDRHFGQTIAEIIAIMTEQSGRRKAEKALQESQERVRFITQKAIDAIISVSDKQQITSWNYGAEVMFGYSEKEMLGKPLHMVIPEADFFHKETSSKPIELKGFHRDNHAFSVEVSHTRWKSGDIYFDTIIIRDITERKNNEKRLIKAMQEAKAANEAKTEFLATVSHELRTPLNAIIGFNQCLLMGMDGDINDSQRASLVKIEKSAFNLLHLINDILDLAKIEANRTEVEIGSYNIVELVVSCFEEVHSMIMQKNIRLYLSVDKPLIVIDFDKAKIRQVLLNLLSNAVKFTEKGEIDVIVLDGSHQVEIQVKDTGIGLSEEEIAKLFKPFSQADSSITRKYGGTGLGLAISKKIVDLHEGSLSIKSIKGEGSTFIFTLPKTGNKEIE